jgi:TRAP-type C4-dicarboxylate transport system substrate-binding protein
MRGVFELPFFAPPTLGLAYEWINAVVNGSPAIQKEMDSWNAKVLFSYGVGPYEYMGKIPFKKVEDLKGNRIRLDPISGAPLEQYGAVMNNIPGPEIYTALDRGMIDSVIFAWPYTFGTYKLNELSKYATLGVEVKIADMYVAASKDAWNALPDEWKKLSEAATAKTIERYLDFRKTDDGKWLDIFKKQQMEIIQLDPVERAKLVDKAKPSWDAWMKDIDGKGLPGTELFKLAQAKKDEILAKSKK